MDVLLSRRAHVAAYLLQNRAVARLICQHEFSSWPVNFLLLQRAAAHVILRSDV